MCLHMRAESGQEQLNFISRGHRKKPCLLPAEPFHVSFENRPSTNSTSESIAPAQSWQTAFHRGFGIGATLTSTW